MKTNRITLLKSYLTRKILYGKNIRWLLEYESGESVYCNKCGNIANNVLVCQRENVFYIPFCKKHFAEIYPNSENIAENEFRLRKNHSTVKIDRYKEDGEIFIEVVLENGYKQAFFIDFGNKKLIAICRKMEIDGVQSRR